MTRISKIGQIGQIGRNPEPRISAELFPKSDGYLMPSPGDLVKGRATDPAQPRASPRSRLPRPSCRALEPARPDPAVYQGSQGWTAFLNLSIQENTA